jgi:hypothetical protein
MNVAKSTERAFALVISQFAEMIAGVSIRPFQCLSEDSFRPKDASGGTRAYPMIDIRSSTPVINATQNSRYVTCTITVATQSDDDPDNKQLSQIYEAVEAVIMAIFNQSKSSDGAELTLMKSVFADAHGNSFHYGGIRIEGGNPPFDDEGISTITQVVTVHYSEK